MKIYVTNNGTVTNRLPKMVSQSQTSASNSNLDIFPQSDILDQIYFDHIYSSRSVNHVLSEEFPNDDEEDNVSDSSEDNGSEAPRKPRVITHRLTVPECIRSAQVIPKHILNDQQNNQEDSVNDEIVKVSSDTEYVTISSLNNEQQPHCSYNYPMDNGKDFTAPLDNDMISLDAESIQKVFQNMICMTSLTPIADISSGSQKESSRETPLQVEEAISNINGKMSVVDNLKLTSTVCSGEGNPAKPLAVSVNDFDRKSQSCMKLKTECNTNTTTDVSNSKSSTSSHKSTESICSSNTDIDSSVKEPTKKKQTRRRFVKGLKRSSKVHIKQPNPLTSSSLGETDKCNDVKTSSEKILNKHTSDCEPPKPTCCQTVNGKEYKEISRGLENEREMSAKLKYALDLLVQKWGEYLTMSAEQIHEMELENARDINMIEEVIDMLADKDRYVWQVIEDLRFF